MTLAVAADVTGQVRERTHLTRDQRWGLATYVAAAIGYLAVGVYLYIVIGYINPDASSRVGNAAFTIWSRNPHLGAVGFVWNPLPSLVEIPMIAVSQSWPFSEVPALRELGFSGAIMSALFMAGAVWQVRRIALDYECGRLLRWAAIATFALNPMIVLYAGLGMSEGPFLFFLLWTCRRILLWVNRERLSDLVMAGCALGLGYLTRYESLVASVAVAGGVLIVSWLRHRPGPDAFRFGLHDAVIVIMPTVAAFVAWALAGWLLDGNPFSQFSSQYGNSAQVAAAGIVSVEDVGVVPLARFVLSELLGIQPCSSRWSRWLRGSPSDAEPSMPRSSERSSAPSSASRSCRYSSVPPSAGSASS